MFPLTVGNGGHHRFSVLTHTTVPAQWRRRRTNLASSSSSPERGRSYKTSIWNRSHPPVRPTTFDEFFSVCLILSNNPSSFCFQKSRFHSQLGMQVGSEGDRPACSKRRVQSQEICCCYHENSRAQNDRSHLCVGQNGVYGCQERGGISTSSEEICSNHPEARLLCQIP